MEYVFYLLAFFITFLVALGLWMYFKSQKKELFNDSQKDSKKLCSQADINYAVNDYVFSDSTQTKI